MSAEDCYELDLADEQHRDKWVGAPESPFRNLTADEVADARATAERTRPEFSGEHNAAWEQHHPVMREVWERLGHIPVKG